MKRRLFTFFLSLSTSLAINARTGYISVHKSTLDENSNPSSGCFSFSGSGGIANFTLNDAPTALSTVDIGACSSGRLYAVANNSYTNSNFL